MTKLRVASQIIAIRQLAFPTFAGGILQALESFPISSAGCPTSRTLLANCPLAPDPFAPPACCRGPAHAPPLSPTANSWPDHAMDMAPRVASEKDVTRLKSWRAGAQGGGWAAGGTAHSTKSGKEASLLTQQSSCGATRVDLRSCTFWPYVGSSLFCFCISLGFGFKPQPCGQV